VVPSKREGARSAIGRSLDIYYRDAARTARMDALNALFVKPGGLAFDIGAHVGDRTGSFLRLGASVVAAEPQPRVFRALRLLHGRHPKASLIRAAVGAEAGTLRLHVNGANPMVSTASPALIAAAAEAETWQGQVWDTAIDVPVTTLDGLISEHGVPDFVKIDVEGHERAVLQGLSTPLPALSFEFTTIQRDVAQACIDRLLALGAYQFNVSFGEDHHLEHDAWIDAPTLREHVQDLPMEANSGDIFARRLA
jgi:FkbM family methyltransferase